MRGQAGLESVIGRIVQKTSHRSAAWGKTAKNGPRRLDPEAKIRAGLAGQMAVEVFRGMKRVVRPSDVGGRVGRGYARLLPVRIAKRHGVSFWL